jgi:hypothetical protein
MPKAKKPEIKPREKFIVAFHLEGCIECMEMCDTEQKAKEYIEKTVNQHRHEDFSTRVAGMKVYKVIQVAHSELNLVWNKDLLKYAEDKA